MANPDTLSFCVCRIIGNELPPRDLPGARLAALRYTLAHEPAIPRFWILNHIHDAHYRQLVIDLLHRSGERFHEIAFEPAVYAALESHLARVTYAINVNSARNRGIALARREARFCVCLDQDCFFTVTTWNDMRERICVDQQAKPDRMYYGLLMKRLVALDEIDNAAAFPSEEPHIVFREDAAELFDETRMFGHADKQELLVRLGYDPAPPYATHTDRCITVGHVFHLRCGPADAERDLNARLLLRNASLSAMLRRLDAMYRTRSP